MKNFYFSFVLLFFGLGVTAQIITIPDASLKAKLIASSTGNDIAKNSFNQSVKIDTNNNGEVEQSEVVAVTQLNLNPFTLLNPGNIANVEGLQYFTNLKVLKCWGNNITSINLTGLNNLEELDCDYNQITDINFAIANQLKKVDCSNNLLTTINTTTFGNAESLFFEHNNLSSLDVSHLGNVKSLYISNNNFSSFDATTMSHLEVFVCGNNSLTSLLINNLSALKEVVCDNNLLTAINLSGLSNVTYFTAVNNTIATINLSPLTSISLIYLSNNPLTSLNVNGLTTLLNLAVSNTLVTNIDCSQAGTTQLVATDCPNLQTINVRNGVYSYSDPDLLFFAFRIQNNPQLVSICTDDGEQNQLALTNYNTSGNVVVYNGINCSIPVSVNMSVNDFNKNVVTIYPNPTSGSINIDVSDNQVINKASITNVLGQTIMSFENASTIDISSLTKGTYFITVETLSGKETQRIIKL